MCSASARIELGSRISRAISAATSGLNSEDDLLFEEELMGMHLKVRINELILRSFDAFVKNIFLIIDLTPQDTRYRKAL